MATTIITKHSATAKDPQPSQLERGELAIDLARKNIYTKDASDAVVQLAESQWKDNGNDIYYNDGNVGINRTPNSNYQLDVAGSARFTTGANVADEFSEIYLGGQTVNNRQAKLRKGTGGTESTALQFYSATGGSSAETKFYRNNVDLSMTIDDSGRVGIGGEPSRSTKEIEDDAVSTLAGWKAQIDDRLKAEPKADKKAVTLEITGEDKLPTKAELIKSLTERNIGGGTAMLQVAGDGYFSGNVNANAFNSNNFRGVAFYNTTAGTNGIRFSTAGQLRPTDNTGTAKDDVLSLGSENFRFKDAHFSGTVNAENVICDQVRGTASGRAGLEFISSSRIVPVDNTGVITDGAANLGSTTGRFNNAYFSGIIRTGSGTTSETGAQIGPAVYSRNAASDGTVANEVWRGYGADVITSRIRSNGDAYFSGTVHAQQFMRDGNPVPTTLDLIETLATLRNATKDEDTLEGLRDALGDAIGGLIQKFEAIQA